MKRIVCAALLALFASTAVPARQAGAPSVEQEKAAIRQAAYDYAEGYYEGAAARMERAVYPLLSKRGLTAFGPGTAPVLVPMNAEMLIEATRRGGGKLAAEQRNIRFDLLDLGKDVASAKIFTARFNDYLLLFRQNGQWRLLNVLWRPPAESPSTSGEAEKAAVQQAVQAFSDAAAAKDGDRLAGLAHPELSMRILVPSGAGGFVPQEVSAEILVAGTRLGRLAAVFPPTPPVVNVLDQYEDIASARVARGDQVTYLHLARQGGQWRMVNALIQLPPPPAQK
jgi:hypothetical protein